MRKAYFKLVQDEKPVSDAKEGSEEQIDFSDGSIDSEDEEELPHSDIKPVKQSQIKEQTRPARLTKKQLSKKKRQEAYHQLKEREEARAKAEKRRIHKKGTIQKRTARGQPKLGSRVGMLLEKLKQDESRP